MRTKPMRELAIEHGTQGATLLKLICFTDEHWKDVSSFIKKLREKCPLWEALSYKAHILYLAFFSFFSTKEKALDKMKLMDCIKILLEKSLGKKFEIERIKEALDAFTLKIGDKELLISTEIPVGTLRELLEQNDEISEALKRDDFREYFEEIFSEEALNASVLIGSLPAWVKALFLIKKAKEEKREEWELLWEIYGDEIRKMFGAKADIVKKLFFEGLTIKIPPLDELFKPELFDKYAAPLLGDEESRKELIEIAKMIKNEDPRFKFSEKDKYLAIHIYWFLKGFQYEPTFSKAKKRFFGLLFRKGVFFADFAEKHVKFDIVIPKKSLLASIRSSFEVEDCLSEHMFWAHPTILLNPLSWMALIRRKTKKRESLFKIRFELGETKEGLCFSIDSFEGKRKEVTGTDVDAVWRNVMPVFLGIASCLDSNLTALVLGPKSYVNILSNFPIEDPISKLPIDVFKRFGPVLFYSQQVLHYMVSQVVPELREHKVVLIA